ncbi:MAG TPA: CoA transferase, partial [Hyphomicrobiaceae bacterium]|nr:CoA transferase [Hyphomicrobiaceae bacterium]
MAWPVSAHTLNNQKNGYGGPLASLKVLELCQVAAGPFCGMLFADMGADVIKVEKLNGDDT